MKFQSLFVTGTDTGVGKTLVTALIALKLRQMGVDCVAFKPFASGCELIDGELISEDAQFLRTALHLDESQDQICPIRLKEPLAPLIAARRAGIPTAKWLETVDAAYRKLKRRHECVIVEGVGGLLAPIWEDDEVRSNLDLIEYWELPTVIVARRTLGTINHTLLTLSMPLEEPAEFIGLVFNDTAPVDAYDVAAGTSPGFITVNTHVPVWGEIPFERDLSPGSLEKLAEQLDIPFGV